MHAAEYKKETYYFIQCINVIYQIIMDWFLNKESYWDVIPEVVLKCNHHNIKAEITP